MYCLPSNTFLCGWHDDPVETILGEPEVSYFRHLIQHVLKHLPIYHSISQKPVNQLVSELLAPFEKVASLSPLGGQYKNISSSLPHFPAFFVIFSSFWSSKWPTWKALAMPLALFTPVETGRLKYHLHNSTYTLRKQL